MSLEWVTLRDYPKYAICREGHIKNIKTGCVLKGSYNREGYKYIDLVTEIGFTKRFLVHVLVMLTFVGECPEGHSIDHINRDRAANSLDNLRYVTISENSKQADHSDDPKGEANSNSKLNRKRWSHI